MRINQVLCGDSIEIMEEFETNSIDSIVTDGPYGLGFMGKIWDKFTSKEYQDFCFEWGSKAIKVLKPGGYCASFSAPRKYHRMVCGLEDSGFLIKDMIEWVFGSGFPKSLNISLAINKHLGGSIIKGDMIIAPDGQSYDKRKKIGNPLTDNCYSGDIIEEEDLYEKIPSNPEALKWDGWGSGLKPAHEPIVLAQKPYEGTYAKNMLKWGVGGLYIDGCRIDYIPDKEVDSRIYNRDKNITRGHHENATLKYAPDGNEFPMFKTLKGRWPSNFVLTHHPECKLIGKKRIGIDNRQIRKAGTVKETLYKGGWNPVDTINYGKEVMDYYQCHPDCPVKMIDEQSGDLSTSFRPNLIGKNYESNSIFGQGGNISIRNQHDDRGGASRFFYCAKAYKKERILGCENVYWEKTNGEFKRITKNQYNLLPSENRAKGNPISTLKPINLMRYLVRLVTPPNGIVLDPFGGSGTTGIACIIESFNYVLIEKRESFAKVIIPKRLEYWKDPKNWKILKDHSLLPKIQIKIKEKQNMSLEAWA